MRIAFLTHEPFYPPSGGGSAEAVYLIRELAARGHEIHLFGPMDAPAAEVEKIFGVAAHPFARWEMGRYTSWRTVKYLLYPFWLERMVRPFARTSPLDLILSQHAISAVAAGRLKQTLRRPAVMNFLDYLTGFMEAWPPSLMPRPILRRLMRFELRLPKRYAADGVLAVSDTLADLFIQSGAPAADVRAIYYGFDSKLFPYRGDAAPARDREPVLIMHGSLDHHHLREIALGSWAHVVRHRPHARLRIVGKQTPALAQFLRRARQLAPKGKIERPGFVPYDQIARELAQADVGIVPYEESMGTHCAFVAKIVEYLAVGLPVVSTRMRSVSRYFAGEPRARFTDFDAESFGRAILDWLDRADPASAQARAASDRVRRELDWSVIARRAADFIEEKANPQRAAP